MFYIVVEGEKEKSAYSVWLEINKKLLGGKAQIIGVPGSGKLYGEMVSDIINKCDTGKNTILCVFDKASGIKVYSMMKFIDNEIIKSRTKGNTIRVIYTREYSFEEWVLSSNNDILIKNNEYRDAIRYYLNKNKNWAKTKDYIRYIEKKNNGTWINREKAASALLSELCIKRAKIVKGEVGLCWTGNEAGTCDNKYCKLDCKWCIDSIIEHEDMTIERFSNILLSLQMEVE